MFLWFSKTPSLVIIQDNSDVKNIGIAVYPSILFIGYIGSNNVEGCVVLNWDKIFSFRGMKGSGHPSWQLNNEGDIYYFLGIIWE